MDPARFTRVDATTWRIEPRGAMRVPAIIYADEDLIRGMDDKVFEQAVNVATLPGIVAASYAMPDAHWGYGFPIGGVAAFDPDQGGIVSAGGVGFDISCGVRTMLTGLTVADILPVQTSLADSLFRQIPAGVGSKGAITLDATDMNAMLSGGARWSVERGWGEARDLGRIEEGGMMAGAKPELVSDRAKERQRREMGTLGSGNHYLEVQAVAEIFDASAAQAFGLAQDHVVVTIHCGSRGLGHQIGTEFLQLVRFGLRRPESSFPTASSLALRSTRKSANATWARCVRESIAPSPIARFLATMHGGFLPTFFRIATCTCCSTSRTIPARRKNTRSQGNSAGCSFIARVRPAPSVPVMRVCPRRCAPSVSRCSSAAAWERAHTSWWARQPVRRKPSRRRAMGPAANCRASPLKR